jgi:pyruvate-ferredoxin/flavodoxin oxidoreductase
MSRTKITIDGNEAAAYVAHHLSEVIAIYPITPSSNMGEWTDEWAARGVRNIWGTVPDVTELQSEGGASGAVHGALQTGSLTTTFTASQGLLLMIPNMYKIAGELTSTVFHISARTIATHALSIFGDHSDVMAARSTGWGQIASGSVQEVMDLALIAHTATLKTRVPFLHFFDGFRTSHEVMKIEQLTKKDMSAMVTDDLVAAHRSRAMTPDHPVLRGSAQNPDVFFQAREAVNSYYDAAPDLVQETMNQFAKVVGRQYHLFDYVGAKDAERIVILMGSGIGAAEEAVDKLTAAGEKVGFIKIRLFRPFSIKHFIQSIPATVKSIAVLDRCKEPGSTGEPLYNDVITALTEAHFSGQLPMAAIPHVIGGRYGLSSKEFTPAMVKAVLDQLKMEKPLNHFSVGIKDDVTNLSLEVDNSFATEGDDVFRAMFFGLGADGTVGANKNSIKIIGEGTDFNAQGYFVYDSKKSGSMTTSHLRFGKEPIRSNYLISKANFIACHSWSFLETKNMLKYAEVGGIFLLNAPMDKELVWNRLPRQVQQTIIDKKLRFYVIDAYTVAGKTGMGARVNTIMQTCFFAISGVLPADEAIKSIKGSIQKTYGVKGEEVVQKNFNAVDQAVANMHEIEYGTEVTSASDLPPVVPAEAPKFVQEVIGKIIADEGDLLPVSKMPLDGTFPTDTTRWEKRNIALTIPVWDNSLCIQCGKCAMVCPHAAIRIKVYDEQLLTDAPETFKSIKPRSKSFDEGARFTVQVAPEDCTGCELCAVNCPGKDKKNPESGLKALVMQAQQPLRAPEKDNWEFFLNLPDYDRTRLNLGRIQEAQLLKPLFEFSGACSGCGETPYYKLITQLYGDRMVVGNATGCSSIYGGNLPTAPWGTDENGRGPTWSNSLFEDNAEFGLGFRLSIDKLNVQALELLSGLTDEVGSELVESITNADQSDEAGIKSQRERVVELRQKLHAISSPEAARLHGIADNLVVRSVWIVGGDGWAYDIGYGGLDHVLASGRNVNVLVLDTEVYSNTGGQMSKATQIGAVAKFAANGKPIAKKNMALMAMNYRNVYVAQIAMGANDVHTLKAIREAEEWDGPSLILAYSHCIAHGIDMSHGLEQQKQAVKSGYYPLFRYDPRRIDENLNPFQLDSKTPAIPVSEYTATETRFRILQKTNPEHAAELTALMQQETDRYWKILRNMAAHNPFAVEEE